MAAYSIENDLCSEDGLRYALEYLLPIVQANSTITYGEIADRLRQDLKIPGIVFAVGIGHVAGTLMNRILEIASGAPLINVLVFNTTRSPGTGVNGYLQDRYGGPLEKKRRDREGGKKGLCVRSVAKD